VSNIEAKKNNREALDFIPSEKNNHDAFVVASKRLSD
jgi:hypothetical protein